jgi:hypothetical protein
MTTTKIISCSCSSTYQDQTYGPGKRLGNLCNSTANKGKYRCTQCGKVG